MVGRVTSLNIEYSLWDFYYFKVLMSYIWCWPCSLTFDGHSFIDWPQLKCWDAAHSVVQMWVYPALFRTTVSRKSQFLPHRFPVGKIQKLLSPDIQFSMCGRFFSSFSICFRAIEWPVLTVRESRLWGTEKEVRKTLRETKFTPLTKHFTSPIPTPMVKLEITGGEKEGRREMD